MELLFSRISPNGRSCEDIDECESQAPCHGRTSQCHNTRGSYKCLDVKCPPGYQLENSGSNRCKRTNTRCRSSDFTCLRSHKPHTAKPRDITV